MVGRGPNQYAHGVVSLGNSLKVYAMCLYELIKMWSLLCYGKVRSSVSAITLIRSCQISGASVLASVRRRMVGGKRIS